MQTKGNEPVIVTWNKDVKLLVTSEHNNLVMYDIHEAIQLRNFLNQLNLEEK